MELPTEPEYVDLPAGGIIRLCGLEFCQQPMYALNICKGHYEQRRRRGEGAEFSPLFYWWHLPEDFPPCSFPGCVNKSITKNGRILCQGHTNHTYLEKGLRPLNYINQGYTENGRVCRACHEEKPLDEFYNRNTHKGSKSKSTKCKDCYKRDVYYYKTKTGTKSDGSDPKGYNK